MAFEIPIPLILAALLSLGWFAYQYFFTGRARPRAEQGAQNLGALNQLSSLIGDAGSTLGGITDVESAKQALPEIEGLTAKVNGLNEKMENLPKPMRHQIGQQASASLPKLQSLVDRVSGIPGVKDALQPTMGELMTEFQNLIS